MSLIVAWQLHEKHVLLIGGGSVASSRFNSLMTAGAQSITIIAKSLNADLDSAVKQAVEKSDSVTNHKINVDVKVRAINKSDFDTPVRYDIVLSAISDRDVSIWVGRTCKSLRIPVNVADIPEYCDFYFGSTIVRGSLQIMVSTGGNSPRLARRIKSVVETAIDELQPAQAISNMGKLRAAIKNKTNHSHDSNIIKLRMKWISEITDKLSFQEMAALQDSDIEHLVNAFPDTPNLRFD